MNSLTMGLINNRPSLPSKAFNWISRNNVGNNINSIATNGTVFVSVGEWDTIKRSLDGITWNEVTSFAFNFDHFFCVIWSINRFIAVGNSSYIYTSPDGLIWTPIIHGLGAGIPFRGITNFGGVLYLTSAFGQIYTSNNNGNTWTLSTSLGHGLFNIITVNFTNVKLITIGREEGAIHTSNDGITWVLRYNRFKITHDIHFNASSSTVVCVGEMGSFAFSTDGITWNELGVVTDGLFVGIDFMCKTISSNANGWVLLGYRDFGSFTSQNLFLSSNNLTLWVRETNTPFVSEPIWGFNDVIWETTRNIYVSVGESGLVYTSNR